MKNLIEGTDISMFENLDEMMQNDPALAEILNKKFELNKGRWLLVPFENSFEFAKEDTVELEEGDARTVKDIVGYIDAIYHYNAIDEIAPDLHRLKGVWVSRRSKIIFVHFGS